MNSGRQSMAGKIYQDKISVPKLSYSINPEQRKINYPIKGDTAFDPNQYGRKHLSPKHSAIHSIIFNQNFNDLMQEKNQILKKLSTNKKSYQRYQQNQKLNDNLKIHNYVDDYLKKQQSSHLNSPNIFQRSKSFHVQSDFQRPQKILKGHLFRQNSISQILRPYEKRFQMPQIIHYQNLKSSKINDVKSLPQIQDSINNFPRYINPNNLNSIF